MKTLSKILIIGTGLIGASVGVESLPFTMAPVFIGNLFVTVSKNYKILNPLMGTVAANPAAAERRTLPKIKLSYLLSKFSSNRQRWAIR
ncbi:MAG: hypothetical protein LBU65_02840 [Planctomycetaceae bacterium]|jgi:hypothetical protein|nr:hypothetical protein [Planctomycetaceae bacterium]